MTSKNPQAGLHPLTYKAALMTELGRGIVVPPGREGPSGWPRVRVDESTLADPAETVALLHGHWLHRAPVTVELAVDAAALKEPQTEGRPPYELGPEFEFYRERLHFLVWANNVDFRGAEPIWWLDRLAGAAKGDQNTDGGPRDEIALACLHRESLDLKRYGLGRTLQRRRPLNLDALTSSQKEAVLHQGGPARVMAPAGSGKTRVLTHRLQHLTGVQGVEPELVTAVAYNRRAQREMKERLGSSCKADIRTIHSLALAIVREVGEPKVIREVQVRRLLAPLVPRGEKRLNQDFLAPYVEALARTRIALVAPEEVESERDDVPEFASVFAAYRRALRSRNLLDYDEQIYSAIRLLCERPDVRAKWQLRCRHLLVDEFQDLTPAYLLLLRLLSAPTYQVFAVGDDDQVIYGYSGADPKFLVDFKSYFPHAKTYDLGMNFRCPVPVVRAAAHLVSRNKTRVEKIIKPGPEAHADGLHLLNRAATDEAEAALSQISAWLEEGRAPEEIAVLTRVNSVLLPVHLGLHEQGVPFNSSLNAQSLHTTGIQVALAYLRMASNVDAFDEDDLLQTLRRPNRRLRNVLLDDLRKSRIGSLEALERASKKMEDWEKEKIDDFLWEMRRLSKLLKKQDVSAALKFVRTTIGLGTSMDELDRSSGPAGSSGGHLDNLLALEQAAVGCPALEDLERLLERGLNAEGDRNGVTLSSVHRVKGQEWPCVLLYGVRNGLFPHRLAGREGLEEERRVFHVALTRASRQATLLIDQDDASPFVAELAPKPQKKKKKKKKKKRAQATFQPGQKVWHKVFGEGTVESHKGQTVTVEFEQSGCKKIKESFLVGGVGGASS